MLTYKSAKQRFQQVAEHKECCKPAFHFQMKVWDANRFTPENNTPIWNNENKVNANHTQHLQVSPANLPHGKKIMKDK